MLADQFRLRLDLQQWLELVEHPAVELAEMQVPTRQGCLLALPVVAVGAQAHQEILAQEGMAGIQAAVAVVVPREWTMWVIPAQVVQVAVALPL